MFIRNLKTKIIQECQNKDIIKICKKHPDEYLVAEKLEDIAEDFAKEKEFSTMKVEELKALATAKGLEGAEKMKKEELIALLKDVI